MRQAAVVLTKHVFNHMGIQKKNLQVFEMVKVNVAVKIRDLYQVSPELRMDIIAKLDDVKNHAYLDSQSFMSLLNVRLSEIKKDLSVERTEIDRISNTVDELIHYLDFNIKGE